MIRFEEMRHGMLKESVPCFGFGAEIKKTDVYKKSQ